MADIIHPTKAGYLFWYTPYIQAQLEKELENKSTDEKEHTVTLTQASHNRYDYNAFGRWLYNRLFKYYVTTILCICW